MSKDKKKTGKRAQKDTIDRLTPLQQKLLESLLNPEERFLSVTKLCEKLNISRKAYYAAQKSPHFQKVYQELSISLTKGAVGPVVNAAIREAVRGSLGHQELVLQMAGLIPGKGKGVEVSVPGDGSIKVKVDLL